MTAYYHPMAIFFSIKFFFIKTRATFLQKKINSLLKKVRLTMIDNKILGFV